MRTANRTTIKATLTGLLSRMTAGRNQTELDPKASQTRLPVKGVSSREYVLRRVASRRVELRGVASESVALQSVGDRASVLPKRRLELAHVFACLKAAAAKSKVSRLLGRTVRQPQTTLCITRSNARASVNPASVVRVSVSKQAASCERQSPSGECELELPASEVSALRPASVPRVSRPRLH